MRTFESFRLKIVYSSGQRTIAEISSLPATLIAKAGDIIENAAKTEQKELTEDENHEFVNLCISPATFGANILSLAQL